MISEHDYMQAWVNLVFTSTFLLQKLSDEMEREFEISLVDQEFLGQVGKAGGEIRMVDLAHNTWVSKAAVTKIVDRLEERGLLKRAPSEHDRRTVHIELTRQGKALLRKTWTKIEAFVAENFADRLNEGEITDLRQTLEKLLVSHDMWESMLARLRGFRRDDDD